MSCHQLTSLLYNIKTIVFCEPQIFLIISYSFDDCCCDFLNTVKDTVSAEFALILLQFGILCVLSNVTAKMTNMVCAACILGVGIGIGGIFLYRVLRQWLRQSPERPSVKENVKQTCNSRSVGKIAGAYDSSETLVWCQSWPFLHDYWITCLLCFTWLLFLLEMHWIQIFEIWSGRFVDSRPARAGLDLQRN